MFHGWHESLLPYSLTCRWTFGWLPGWAVGDTAALGAPGWGWGAQWVERRASARAMISQFVGSSPASIRLCTHSLLWILCLPHSLPLTRLRSGIPGSYGWGVVHFFKIRAMRLKCDGRACESLGVGLVPSVRQLRDKKGGPQDGGRAGTQTPTPSCEWKLVGVPSISLSLNLATSKSHSARCCPLRPWFLVGAQ